MSTNHLPPGKITLIGQFVSPSTLSALNAKLSTVSKKSFDPTAFDNLEEREKRIEEIQKECALCQKYNSNPNTDYTADIGSLHIKVTRMTVMITGDIPEKAEFYVEIATREFPFSYFQLSIPLSSAVACPINPLSNIMYTPYITMNQNFSRKVRNETREAIIEFCSEMASKVTFADKDHLEEIF